MPSYPFMFEIKDEAEPGDRVVQLPPGYGPIGKIVVAKAEVLDLVSYLQGLDHTYPVREASKK
jgi:cytochrome c oxidase cbb3-type subunit 2